jgi:cytochrome c-type biogenesis protein CcmE
MSHKAAKIGVTSLVLLTAFGVLMYTTLGESMQYYKYVDEVVAQPDAWKDKNLQVHGYVVPGSIGKKRDTLDYRFEIQRNGPEVEAQIWLPSVTTCCWQRSSSAHMRPRFQWVVPGAARAR